MKQRYCYLDILRCLAIFFVCTYHFWWDGSIAFSYDMGLLTVPRRFFAGILTVCVPLFLMASGAVLLNRPLDPKRHYRNMLRLLVTYVLWRSITLLVLGWQAGIPLGSLSPVQLVNHFLLQVPFEGVDESHFWYIPMLLCVYFLAPLYKKIFDDGQSDPNSRIILIVTLGLLFFSSFLIRDLKNLQTILAPAEGLQLGAFQAFDPFARHSGSMSLYFLLGGILHKHRQKAAALPLWIPLGTMLLGMLALLGIWYGMSWRLGYNYDTIFEGYVTTPGLLCSCALFLLAMRWEQAAEKKPALRKLLSLVGRNTIFVYYLHWILGYTLLYWLPIPVGPHGNFLKAALLVSVCTLAGEAIRRIPVLNKLLC